MDSKTSVLIQNQYIQAEIYFLGAELHSLRRKSDQREYLWQADPRFWNRHAPILFPVVGRLNHHSFTFEGKNYSLGQHGFARDTAFDLVRQDASSVTFGLHHDRISQPYPFKFLFEVTYTLEDYTLVQTFRCRNLGSGPMYFSVGGHPAFHCNPIESGTLTFEPPLDHDLWRLEDGSIHHQPVDHIQASQIALDSATFNHDALIFEHTQNLHISLVQNYQKVLTVSTEDMPSLGLWSKPGAPYVCIEPWDGLADFDIHDGDIRKKRGIVELNPEEQYEKGFRITLYAD